MPNNNNIGRPGFKLVRLKISETVRNIMAIIINRKTFSERTFAANLRKRESVTKKRKIRKTFLFLDRYKN